MTLVHVADGAFPLADYSVLPADVRVFLGYVGEDGWTPHVWTVTEVAAVHDAGLTWGPICTVPQRALTGVDGSLAAWVMVARLHELGYTAGWPVFLDVERSAYAADVGGALACVRAWVAGMSAAGWPVCVPYLPLVANGGWVADWTGIRPAQIPDGWSGQQYEGSATHPGYDLSVMRADLWPAGVLDTTTEVVDMTPDEHNMLHDVWDRLAKIDNLAYAMGNSVLPALTDIRNVVDSTIAQHPAGAAISDADRTAIADAVTRELALKLGQ